MLNDLLVRGNDASLGNAEWIKARKAREQQAREEAIEIIDDVLFTDYHDVITRKERGNLYQLGILGKLNTYYFNQFLDQSYEVKEEYKAEYEQIKTDFLSQID